MLAPIWSYSSEKLFGERESFGLQAFKYARHAFHVV